MNGRLGELIEGFVSGSLGETELAELNGLLAGSEEARRAFAHAVDQEQSLRELYSAPKVEDFSDRLTESQRMAIPSRVSARRAVVSRHSSTSRRRRSVSDESRRFAPILALSGAAAAILLIALIASSTTSTPTTTVKTQPLPSPERSKRITETETRLVEIQRAKDQILSEPNSTPEKSDQRRASLEQLETQRRAMEAELAALAALREERATETPQERPAPQPLVAEQRPQLVPTTPVTPVPVNASATSELGRVVFAEKDGLTLVRAGRRETLASDAVLKVGDTLETGAGAKHAARAALALFTGTTLELGTNTRLTISAERNVTLESGRLYAHVEKPTGDALRGYTLTIKHAVASIGVTGTRFEVQGQPSSLAVRMEEGTLDVFNARGKRAVSAGHECITFADKTPGEPAAINTNSVWTGRGGIPALKKLNDGLLAFWKLDEGQGIRAADSSAHARECRVAGAKWIPGRNGGAALSFDPRGARLEGPDLDLGDRFTLAVWFKQQDEQTRLAVIAANTIGGSNNDGFRFFIHNRPKGVRDAIADGSIHFETATADGTSRSTVTKPGVYPPGDAWHHLTFVAERSEGRAAIYVDGVKVVERTITTSFKTNAKIFFGSFAGNPTGMDGALDDIRLYDRALSEIEIEALAGQ